MADASKLKQLRRSGLGAPPPMEEARVDLAPLPSPPGRAVEEQPKVQSSQTAQPPAPPPSLSETRIDGRTLRRSGRIIQFATRVSPQFDRRVRQIAKREGLLIVEVLERALDALEAKR
jgi:hypothetical protein